MSRTDVKAYRVQFDGGWSVVIAKSFAEAVAKWRATQIAEFGPGSGWDETSEPESVELIADEVIQ